MKTPKKPLQILLSGAGITANALAYFLTRQGHRLTVVERAPALRDSGLQIDLRGPGVEVIRRMGLEGPLKRKTIKEDGIQVVDGQGRRRAWFPVAKQLSGDEKGSGKGSESGERKGQRKTKTTLSTEWEVMRGDLCRLLYDAATNQGLGQSLGQTPGGRTGQVKYLFGTSIQDLHETRDGVAVSFSTGEKEQFDLVVGADGQNSKVRELLLQMQAQDRQDDTFKPLGVYAGLFTTAWPLDSTSSSPSSSQQPSFPDSSNNSQLIGTAYLAPSKRAIFTRHHRPDRIQVYLFCRTDSPSFSDLRKGHLDPSEEKELMIRHFQGAGWETDRFMRALEKAEDFYCERIGFVRMRRWSSLPHPTSSSSSSETSSGDGEERARPGGRIVLVGDAAYAPSVTTGMGTTAGVVGAYVLAGEIGKYCAPCAPRSIYGSATEAGSEAESESASASTQSDAQTGGLRTAVHEYERTLRPFVEYIQKDLSEGSSAWDSLPETRFGVGVWNAMLSVSSWLRLDTFGSWVRDDKGDGWKLPDYKE